MTKEEIVRNMAFLLLFLVFGLSVTLFIFYFAIKALM